MGLRQQITGWVGFDRTSVAPYVANSRNNTGMPGGRRRRSRSSRSVDYQVTNVDIFVIVGAIVIMVVLDQFVKRSRLGRGIRAVAMDPEAAALMGVNRDRVIQVTFLVGGVMAGAAAVFYMLKIGITRYDVGFILGVKAFTAAVLGGIGNLRGALARRLRPRPRGELRVRPRRHAVEGRRRVRPADPHPPLPAHRPAR